MGMGVYKRGQKLWVCFSYKNVFCREPLNIKDTKANRKYAEGQLLEIEHRIASKTFNYADYFPDSKKCQLFGGKKQISITFGQLFEEWKTNAEKRKKAGRISESTYKNYIKETKLFYDTYKDFNLTHVTKADIDDFIIEYSMGRKAKTINNALTTLRQIFNYAIDKDYIEISPMQKVKQLKAEKPDIHPFTHEEMMKILKELEDTRAYPIIATMFFTGMRTGEVLAMKWENVDFNDWTYHVKESFSNNKLTNTKTIDSRRIVSLTKPMQQLLTSHKAETFLRSDFIFLNKDGKPYTSSWSIVEYYWKDALKRAKVAYRIPYQCRHTFAVLSLKLGDDPEDVAKQLGHTSLQMLFTRYARFIKDRAKSESKFAESITISSQSKKGQSQVTDLSKESE